MALSIKEIATAFSGGQFEQVYDYLTDDVQWNVVGEKLLIGKPAIIDFCTETAQYFEKVTTVFKMDSLIVDTNGVAISGTAEFIIPDENRSNYISSCDIYKFREGMLYEAISYCINTGKPSR